MIWATLGCQPAVMRGGLGEGPAEALQVLSRIQSVFWRGVRLGQLGRGAHMMVPWLGCSWYSYTLKKRHRGLAQVGWV